jgi:hypothetical protein
MSVDDRAFLSAFKTATLPFEEWNHRAHLRMAYCMLVAEGEQAEEAIVRGIQAFNALHHERLQVGYHDTITQFWIGAVRCAFLARHNTGRSHDNYTDSDAFLADNPALMDTGIMFKHYSREVLFSSEAKAALVPPDLEPLP